MYKFSDIRALQLEVSNYCNAACPQCPRNYFGGRTIPTLPLKTWTLVDFKKIFSNDLLQQLEQVYFCGTYGDPLTNPNIVNMCKFLKESNPNINIGMFSPSLFLTGLSFESFREKFLKEFSYQKGFLFDAANFDDVSRDWGINFVIFKGGVNNNENFEYTDTPKEKDEKRAGRAGYAGYSGCAGRAGTVTGTAVPHDSQFKNNL